MLAGYLLVFGLLCCSQITEAHGIHYRNNSQDFSYSPENVRITTFIDTDSSVQHMEPDLFIKGNILYTDNCALKTTDGVTSSSIAGHSTTCYNHLGVGVLARFHEITGFRQISPSEVVVADFHQHCLKLINRITLQVTRYAGYCGSYGYTTGTSGARFFYPHSVISDIKRPGMLLVTDRSNDAVRHVNTLSSGPYGTVSNFVQSTSYLDNPRGITQHAVSGDLYLTNLDDEVWKITYSSKSVSLLAGSPSSTFRDCDFNTAYFNDPYELIFISDNNLLLADQNNQRLRVLNLKTSHTSSLCTGSASHTDGDPKTCTLYSPRALMILNDTLYVGEYQRIRKVQDKRITACSAPEYTTIASEDYGFAELEVPLLEGVGRMTLMPGLYPFKIDTDIVNCTLNIRVLDQHVRRRLYFESEYSVSSCETAPGNVSNSSLIYTMAEYSYRQLSDVCKTDCGRADGTDIMITCTNGTLTLSWPTDIIYNGSALNIPEDLTETLEQRIQDKGAAFYLVILTHTPPVVFPDIAPNGGYTKPVLHSYCNTDDRTYNPFKDSCEK